MPARIASLRPRYSVGTVHDSDGQISRAATLAGLAALLAALMRAAGYSGVTKPDSTIETGRRARSKGTAQDLILSEL